MGLSQDRHAPTELNGEQLEEVRNNPELGVLRKDRERCKNQIHDQGFYPLAAAEGTDLYEQYKKAKHKIASTNQKLRRQRLDKAIIRDFHDSVDTIEITKQLSGATATNVLALPTVEFEFQERISGSIHL